MTMKRDGEPWMSADTYGKSLPKGVGVNLLTADIEALLGFMVDVLDATTLYSDADFAALIVAGSPLMLHSDHTYADHPLSGIVAGAETRGVGAEIRIYGIDPDTAEAKARDGNFIVLAGSIDKPHGLRECFLVGPDGYIFVPSVALLDQ